MGFITPALKRHSNSVSWHLETGLRTINQKNLLNVASSNGEGVFSWRSVLPKITGEVGVCVHMWFWKVPWAWYLIMSIPHSQQKLKETVMIWQLSENSFQVWSPKIDHCVSAFVELLDLMFSLCCSILDMGHLKEGTKQPVNLQDFFSPR